MKLLARKLLCLAGFLCLFAIISKGFYFLFGDVRIISNATAMAIADWISTPSAPEDIYDVYDYADISLNILLSVMVYSVLVLFIPLRNIREKTAGQLVKNAMMGIVIRLLKVIGVIVLFSGFLYLIDYEWFISADAGYAIPLVVVLNSLLTAGAYWLVVCVIQRVKSNNGA
ncbi:hypothetical protein [Rahnella laticis]|uniref:hypothetical protein n=1 Tax=Rahnella laticis TaxID=2787622 RepID=UPI0018A2D63E|nr:hypothetical protein [Rahnella laticis]MBF7994988.1 hypothetical protein [Rahnella laticis]